VCHDTLLNSKRNEGIKRELLISQTEFMGGKKTEETGKNMLKG
jgi:hypothetical protein